MVATSGNAPPRATEPERDLNIMTMRTYRYFVCPNRHKGEERTSENDQPYSKSWESVKVTGMRDAGKDHKGLAAYVCAQCGQPMGESGNNCPGAENMKLKLLQFNYGNGGGNAHFQLIGPKPGSGLEPQPYIAITVAYRLYSTMPACNQESEDTRILSCGPQQFAWFNFMVEEVCNGGNQNDWPSAAEYRPKVVNVMTSILCFAELAHVADPIPAVLPIAP